MNNYHNMNIDIIDCNISNNIIFYNDIDGLKRCKDSITRYISEVFIQPKFQYGTGENNIDMINHININFKYRYIESLNGIIISNRKELIQNVLTKLNINIHNKFINTILLEKKINKIENKITKIQNIIENSYNMILPEKMFLLNNKIEEYMKMKNIMISIIQFINKYYKIYYNPQPKITVIDGNKKGKVVENIINEKIKNILKNKNNECDIMYISNIDYNILHRKIKNKDNNFKQEIDGMICIKVLENNNIMWLPIIIVETKTNVNLIYNDINKFNSLHNRLQNFGNIVIYNNNISYNIMGSGFKSCNLFYYVSEINQLIDNSFIKFINDNYFSKSVIYEIIMSKIKDRINSNIYITNLFTDVMELDKYIMNMFNNMSSNNQTIEKCNKMNDELYSNLKNIQSKNNLYDLYNNTKYDNTIYYIDDSIFLNFIKSSYYVFLQDNNIITDEMVEIIKFKLYEISNNFRNFETRDDTQILLVC